MDEFGNLDDLKKGPNPDEDKLDFGLRLEAAGHCEFFIRKSLMKHWKMGLDDLAEYCENFPIARMRIVHQFHDLRPIRPDSALGASVARCLGISTVKGVHLVTQFRKLKTEDRPEYYYTLAF